MTAMGGGQATHPSGNIYCGSRAEWSTEQLRALVRDRFGAAEKVALVDWHTGLGAFGQVTLLPEAGGVGEVDEWIQRWWGGTQAGDTLQGPNKPRFVGQVVHGVARDLRRRGVRVASTVAEFGTFENRGVLAALLIDRWLRFACPDRTSPKAVRLHTLMMERLNPTLPEWRRMVLSEGARITDSTVAGLAHWP
jgi:hypothetical protein